MTRTGRFRLLLAGPAALALAALFTPLLEGQVAQPAPPQAPPPALLLGGIAVPPAFPAEGPGSQQYTEAVTYPVDRIAKSRIQAAQDYIKKEDWLIATRCLQELLDNKDSFLEVKAALPGGGETVDRVSVHVEANRLVGQLPPAGLNFYRIKYGKEAELRLKEALDQGDPEVLAEVMRRFFHTKAGAEATDLLGTYHLDRGNYNQASQCFDRLIPWQDRSAGTVKGVVEPRLLYKAVVAFKRTGEKFYGDLAEKLWQQLESEVGGIGLTIGRANVPLELLRKEVDRRGSAVALGGLAEYSMVRGNPSRTAQANGGIPLMEDRFDSKVSMFEHPEALPSGLPDDRDSKAGRKWIKDNLKEVFREAEAQNVGTLPAFFPIAAPGKLIVRTYEGIFAYALRDDPAQEQKAGELLWGQSDDYGLLAMARDPALLSQAVDPILWRQGYRQVGPRGVFYENSLIGSLSHDGKRAYFIDDLALPPHPSAAANAAGFGGAAPPSVFASHEKFNKAIHANMLKAVNLETGKLEWILGLMPPDEQAANAAAKPEEPRKEPAKPSDKPEIKPEDRTDLLTEKQAETTPADLFDCFYLGAPLPLSGKLYVLSEKKSQLRLICLDPSVLVPVNPAKPEIKAPKICWVQELPSFVHGLDKDCMRRFQAAHIAFGEGVLVCPTNAGAILGVDLLTRSLVWTHAYRDSKTQAELSPAVGGFGGGRRFRGEVPRIDLNPERWRPAPPAIAAGKVVFTAYDSNSVQCLSLRDGKPKWSYPRSTDDLYFAGVYDNKVIIVGKNSVKALNLADSQMELKVLWEVKGIGMPAGQGVASENVYYLPLKADADKKEPGIARIDLANGRLVNPVIKCRKKEFVPGNLLFFEGDLYSQGAEAIAAFPQLETKIAEMNKLLQANPKDPQGLLERGTLMLDKGQLDPAIADLRLVLEQQPQAILRDRAREKLYESLTELLRERFGDGEKFLGEYEKLCRVDVPEDAGAEQRRRLQEDQINRQSKRLELIGKGREGQGRLVEAFQAYEDFGLLTGNRELVQSIEEPSTLSRPDVWARGRITALVNKADPQKRKPLENLIRQKFERLKAGNDLEGLKGFVSVFGETAGVGREARLELAARLLAVGGEEELRDAELQLLQLRRASGEDRASVARALELLARVMIRKGLLEDAVACYRQLGEQFGDVTLSDGRTGADLLADVLTDKRFLPYLEQPRSPWSGRYKGQDLTGQPMAMSQSFTFEPQGDLLPFFHRYRLVVDQNASGGWQFKVVDRTAPGKEPRWKMTGLQANSLSPYSGFPSGVNTPRFAYARGHLLVLCLNHTVYALDLADNRKLWERDLLGKSAAAATGPAQQHVTGDPDGSLWLMSQDGTRKRIGQVGVVEASYVCLQTREGLEALDPIRGTTLWKKTDVPSQCHIFGDGEFVYLVDVGSDGNSFGKTYAVRASDGVSVPVPDFSALFAPSKRVGRPLDRHLVLFEDVNGGKALRLYDVQAGKDDWHQQFPAGSVLLRGEDPTLIGAIEPSGRVQVFDLKARKLRFEARITEKEHLDLIPKLQDAHLYLDREKYYIALNRAQEPGFNSTANVGNGLQAERLGGPLYAFDRDSNELAWWRDDMANQWLVLEQFSDLPLLLLAAQYNRLNPQGNLERNGVWVTAIDKRTGKLVYDNDKLSPNNGQFITVSAEPQTGVIELGRYDLRVKFTPDTAPAQSRTDAKPAPLTK
jgi:outer membrane protein assembly factor BamB